MRWTAAFLLIVLATTIAPVAAQPQTAPRRVVLDNGLTVIVQENHATEVVTLQAWVKVGSRDETDETNGGAHFIEHMLFKGTPRRTVGQIFRDVEAMGGEINASTSYDFTQFYIIAAGRFFDRVLAIQADALQHSTFDPAEFERERLVVIEELNRREDSPSTFSFDLLSTVAFTQHPYRRTVIGPRANLQRMTRDQLYEFYRTFYVPANVTVVVVGDVHAEDVIARVRRAYGGWRTTGPPRQQFPPEPPMTAIRRIVREQDVRVAYLRLGWLGPAARERDVYAMDVLLYVLGRGRAARLVRNVREGQRLVQDISAGFFTSADPNLFLVAAVTEPDALARAEEAILAEIAAVRVGGVTAEELQRAKTLLEGEDIVATSTTRGLASTLGFYATVADLDFALTYREHIRAVTAEDVQRVAQRYLDPQRYAAVVIRPRRP